MSLDVSAALLDQAEAGRIDEAAFVDCVRASLPYAWDTISGVVAELRRGGSELADNQVPPPDEHARGQLLRALASDAIRGALERHFDVTLAFQNCHRVAAFRRDATGGASHRAFVSPLEQVRNQSPALRDC
jgi:hypothetical protein